MEVCYFSDLARRESFRAVHDPHAGRLYLERLPAEEITEPVEAADLGRFPIFDRQLLSTVAAGLVAVGRLNCHALAL